MVEDASNGSTHAVIEPFGGIRVNGTACIFVAALADSVMYDEGFADGQEEPPLVAHQMDRLSITQALASPTEAPVSS